MDGSAKAAVREYGTGVRLGVPDDYEFMEPKLIRILKSRIEPYMKDAGTTQVD